MVRANRAAHKLHLGFVRRLAAFHIVAAEAGAHEVLPRVLAAAAFWNNVIDGQRHTSRAAIHALMPIAAKNIFSRQNYFFERHPNIRRKPNNTRKRHCHRSGVDCPTRHSAHQFCFRKIKEDNGLLHARDRERFVIAIEDQDFPIQLGMCGAKLVAIVDRETLLMRMMGQPR